MSSSRQHFHLHELILLLALRDRKGTVDFRAGHYHLAIGGAIFGELALTGRIRVEEHRKARVDAVEGASPLGEDILDEALSMVRASKRRRPASAWVQRFGHMKHLRHRTALGLCRRGILRARTSQILFVFSRKEYPTLDPGPERELVAGLRKAVMNDSVVGPSLGILLSLAHATGLLKVVFERKELARRKARLKEIKAGNHIGETGADTIAATQQAVQAAVAAIQAAVVATQTAVAASVAASSSS